MLAEIRAAQPDLNVEVLGVNRTGDAGFNSLVVPDRKLPWLQDTTQDAVWSRWNIVYRDVRIVGADGSLARVYNLTQNDLANPQNYAALKQWFLESAHVVDSDGDQLPDDWEWRYFGNLLAGSLADSDRDGSNNFSEYAFGTDPVDPQSEPSLASGMFLKAPGIIELTFRRQAGSFLGYVVDGSPGVEQWGGTGAGLTVRGARNLFDGTGRVEIIASIVADAPQRFFRLRALPRR